LPEAGVFIGGDFAVPGAISAVARQYGAGQQVIDTQFERELSAYFMKCFKQSPARWSGSQFSFPPVSSFSLFT